MILDFNTFTCLEEMNKYFTKKYYKYPPLEDMIRLRESTSVDPIEEGLISTYPADVMVRYISNKFGVKNEGEQSDAYNPEHISFCKSKRSYRIYVNPEFYKENEDIINKILNSGGYYHAIDADKFIIFERRFDDEISDEIRNSGQIYLYHISPTINTKKIITNGLIPKSKNMAFNYPDRIYLFGKEAEKYPNFLQEMCKMLLRASASAYYRKSGDIDTARQDVLKRKLNEFSVFRIDLDKLENIKIFEDPNIDGCVAYYVNDNIKPDCIEDTGKKFKFNI